MNQAQCPRNSNSDRHIARTTVQSKSRFHHATRFYTGETCHLSFMVHPAKARTGLKKFGRAGLVWSCTKRFRQEKTAGPQPCYITDLESVAIGT